MHISRLNTVMSTVYTKKDKEKASRFTLYTLYTLLHIFERILFDRVKLSERLTGRISRQQRSKDAAEQREQPRECTTFPIECLWVASVRSSTFSARFWNISCAGRCHLAAEMSRAGMRYDECRRYSFAERRARCFSINSPRILMRASTR